MIKGITHDDEGNLHKITKYKGKISTGFAPGEGVNQTNYPSAAGFFRMLKEVVVSKRVGPKKRVVSEKEWILNEQVQEALEKSLPKPNKTPRRVEIVCLHKGPQDMWESSMAMYSKSEGLMCKSHGFGTTARYLTFDDSGDRQWIEREFDGKKGCAFKECPDYQEKKCKPIGLLKCFPIVDMSPNPYRFETRSINTIIGIESSLQDMAMLIQAAHTVKQMEAKKELPFDGFFGAKLFLVHKKIKSGGRDVYITDLMPTEEFTESVMGPIKRGLEQKSKHAGMIGPKGSISMLESASQKLLESTKEEPEVEIDNEDEKSIARNFSGKEDEQEEKKPEAETAAEQLLGD